MAQTHDNATYATDKSVSAAFYGPILLAQKQKLFDLFVRAFPPDSSRTILNLGVNSALDRPEQYFFEHNYPHRASVTGAGLEPPRRYAEFFPEAGYVQVARHEPLPFEDDAFDLVFCNAVIEHVGDRAAQATFMREILRVGKSAWITTPNRWHPIEFHTITPLIHFLPEPIYREIWRRMGFTFFCEEEHLNLLDEALLTSFVPDGVDYTMHKHHFLGFCSNLLLQIDTTRAG